MFSDFYFRRFGYCERQVAVPPHSNLGMAVVIPCFCEPDLIGSLESLWACARPDCAVEVIIVINAPAGCPVEIRAQNLSTLEAARQWAASHRDPALVFHCLGFLDLPAKHAGVGLARKIGMDEAVRRFVDVGRPEAGVIACFDADCQCDPDYLVKLERHFDQNPDTPGCSIYFEHPLDGPLPTQVYDAVRIYELHLRYYVQALRHARFPYAFHTVGSSMAARSGVYQRQGGMNKRQAGEDFYFLHKIIPLGGFTELSATRVIPSPRASNRVPFGTGRAVSEFLDGGSLSTYPLEAFLDLKFLFGSVEASSMDGGLAGLEPKGELSPVLRQFLDQEEFEEALREMRANTASPGSFRKRFFGWFNGFRVMKFIHYARASSYGPRDVESEALSLLRLLKPPGLAQETRSTHELLLRFRQLDRGGGGGVQATV